MKKILKFSLFLFILGALFIGVWLGFNLWPRTIEPPLWSPSDLQISLKEGNNSYDDLVSLKKDPRVKSLDIPDDLSLLRKNYTEDQAEIAQFWSYAGDHAAQISAFLSQKSPALQAYEKLLDAPQFVDQDLPDAKVPSAPWLTLSDLHKLGALHVIQKILESDLNAAFSFWLKMFRFDQSALATARSSVSHMFALAMLNEDLALLSYLRAYPAPNGFSVEESLKAFNPDSISFRRALIFDYLFALKGEEIMASDRGGQKNMGLESLFNRSFYRRDLNDQYRRLEALNQNPASLSDSTIKQFQDENDALTSGAFWWYSNPGGKLLRQLFFVNPVDPMRDFYEGKEEIKKVRGQMLGKPISSPR